MAIDSGSLSVHRGQSTVVALRANFSSPSSASDIVGHPAQRGMQSIVVDSWREKQNELTKVKFAVVGFRLWHCLQQSQHRKAPMGIHEYPMAPMGTHGHPWASVGIHGHPLVPMGTYRYQWIPMGTNGYTVVSMGTHGFNNPVV
jgi:hypothetical protein